MSKELGRKLKFLRSRTGFTQNQIAERLSVDRSTYSNYERAVTEPDIKTLIKLAKIFNVDVDELLTDVEEAPRVAEPSGVPIYTLTKEEKEFIVRLRVINAEQKREIFDTLETFSEDNNKN